MKNLDARLAKVYVFLSPYGLPLKAGQWTRYRHIQYTTVELLLRYVSLS